MKRILIACLVIASGTNAYAMQFRKAFKPKHRTLVGFDTRSLIKIDPLFPVTSKSERLAIAAVERSLQVEEARKQKNQAGIKEFLAGVEEGTIQLMDDLQLIEALNSSLTNSLQHLAEARKLLKKKEDELKKVQAKLTELQLPASIDHMYS